MITKNNIAQVLLETYGKDSLSYFALHEKKKFFFSSTGRSFLAYTVHGKTAMVTGDPIGPARDIPKLLKEFNYFAKGAHLTSCFMAVNESTMQDLLKLGHTRLRLGKEAIIILKDFNKQGLRKKVRRAERYVSEQDITCQIFKRNTIPAKYLEQLYAVTDEWLQEKGGKEKRFTMSLGRIPTEFDPDCEIVLALQNDVVIGYLMFVPVYATNSLSLDTARKKKNVPNGLTEFLLIQSLEYFKSQGINTVSLNFATFQYSVDNVTMFSRKYFLTIVYRLFSHLYKTNSLYNFNKKFLPNWHERYFVFEKKRHLPLHLFAIAKTEL